uniref:Uncharacterized protein n=1 Tax=Arundo donax TaxID=35708 RepID=A0A0A8YBX2_ARUDO
MESTDRDDCSTRTKGSQD